MGIFNKNDQASSSKSPSKNSNQPLYANESKSSNPYYQSESTFDPYNPEMGSSYHQGMNGFYEPQYHQRPLRPNFTKKELENVELPSQIAKQIRWEKLRITGLLFLGTFGFAISLFFVLVHYFAPVVDDSKLKIPTKFIPHPIPMFILMVVSILFLLLGLIDFSHLRIDVKMYKSDLLMGVEKIPYFLIRNYKALISRPIYMNWIAFNIYIWGGIVTGIFYIIRSATHGNTPMHTEIIIMIAILGLTLVIHILSLFTIRARKGSLNAYYGYEIIPFNQVKDIRKRANRICLIIFFIFLAIVLFVVIIPWLIVRKKRGKVLIPFT